MEIKANYILVGTVCLLIFLGAFGFTLWISKTSRGQDISEYEITITENVTGLVNNSDVLFSGIKVGTVKSLEISDKVPGAISALVSINSKTPIREDSEATLDFKGVTGVKLITISGGSASSKLIKLSPGEIGTIKYKNSPVSSVFNEVPNAFELTNTILLQVKDLLSDENEKGVNTIITSTSEVLSNFANNKEHINNIIVNLDKTLKNLASASSSASQAMAKLNSMLTAIQPNVSAFSYDGLSDMRLLISESRDLIQNMVRLTNKLENNPQQFFFGSTIKEYSPK